MIQFFSASSPNVQFTFESVDGSFALTKLMVNLTINKTLFPKADNVEENINLTMTKATNVFKTPLKTFYKCSQDTQIELESSSTNVTSASLQFVNIQKLEAFANKPSEKMTTCFHDNMHTAQSTSWDLSEPNDDSCFRMNTTASFTLVYTNIIGNSMTTNIPLLSDANATATCDDTTVNVTFGLEKDQSVVAKLYFVSKKQSSNYYLDAATLTMDTTSRYLPNHPIKSTKVVENGTKLEVFKTSIDSSFECDAPLNISITSHLSAMFNMTNLQAFRLPNSGFSKGSKCPEMLPTPMPGTTPHPDPLQPPTYHWEGLDSNNKKMCFRAIAGIQLRVSYVNTANVNQSYDTWFDMNNSSITQATDCSKNSFNFSIIDENRNQNLTLTFNKNNSSVSLTSVQYDFVFSNDTFAMAPSKPVVINTRSTDLMIMPTKLGNSYSCSIETQVSLLTNNTQVSDIFMRITDVTMFQAYVPADNSSKDEVCFHDTKKSPASSGDWAVKDVKTNMTCARFKSTLQLKIMYLDISQKMQISTINVNGSGVTMLAGSCSSNVTSITLDVDGTKLMNLTLSFVKPKPVGNTESDVVKYMLDEVTLSYKTNLWYLQNHPEYGKTVTIKHGGLMFGATPVTNSFRCDLQQTVFVNSNTTKDMLLVMMKDTQWEAFGMNKSGDFNDANFCDAEVTTPASVTTPMVTTNAPYQPVDPSLHSYKVVDSKNNKTCFLATIGVQMRTTYNTINQSGVEIGFNFNSNNSVVSATCEGETSIVMFNNSKMQQFLSLTFTRNIKLNQTYLSGINVQYNVTNNFPNANASEKNGNPYMYSVNDLTEMSTPLKHSYTCQTVENDILVNATSNVIVRITGVQLQAFDIQQNKFSTPQKCFSDEVLPEANVGNWTVIANKSICSMYMFSATANITYVNLLGKRTNTRIPLDNSTKTVVGGECGNQISYFWVQMEQVTFNFFFNRTSLGPKFNYYLFDVHIQYNTNSKYFPNHAYDSDGKVTVANSSLHLFQSDQDHSYKCTTTTKVLLNETQCYVSLANVQLQPYGVDKNHGLFSTADDCKSDLSPIIPIIVGSVLAGLILLVVVAYFIGRSRSRKPEYETI
uniref:Uncharacterized LOC100185667 n=1 Tax=Ciona intestinalis TaxID=7719 RepID=F7A4U7_CIOIN|nr:uncharacterized protein LOC100185667 [Ciona intestinalis]|eukprot:XP_026694599.1 uncharacterized protein LOC100185667 [Ciona intestinalis]